MISNLDDKLESLKKGIILPLEALQKGADVSAQAIQNGVVTSIGAIQSVFDIKGQSLAVINGVIGDSLAEQDSELSIQMELVGKVQNGKLCIMVHGLCAWDETWYFNKDTKKSYASMLQKDLGYSNLSLRYNSGRHISTNGQELATLIEQTCQKSKYKIREIVFIGHSLGGLVVRSACHYGQKNKLDWVQAVNKVFLLGTPHQGADFEKLGNLTSSILKMIPNIVTKGISALGNKRSAAIKDLRFGYLLDEDWKGQDQDAFWKDNRHAVPLLDHVDYYIIAACLAKEADNVFTQYFGDGLVNARSVSGKSLLKSKKIPFPKKHFKTFKGLSHVKLCYNGDVYKQIRKWCRN